MRNPAVLLLPRWTYLRLTARKGGTRLYTAVLSKQDLSQEALDALSAQLRIKVEAVVSTPLSFSASEELVAACAYLHQAHLCRFDLGFKFGVYAHDVLKLDSERPRLASWAIAQAIAAATLGVAAASARLWVSWVRES